VRGSRDATARDEISEWPAGECLAGVEVSGSTRKRRSCSCPTTPSVFSRSA